MTHYKGLSFIQFPKFYDFDNGHFIPYDAVPLMDVNPMTSKVGKNKVENVKNLN